MRKPSVHIMVCVLLLCFCVTGKGSYASSKQPPDVSAQAAAMIDVHSGRLLFAKKAHEEKPIASITKIMTAIVAIEHGDLNAKVTVSRNAAHKEGSSIYLQAGEQMTLHHLLYGLMLRSGNDAAVAIAEHIGGSLDGFVLLMNEKAEYLGLTGTHFANPHGLDEEGHYSTAYDMAALTRYALKNNVFREIVASSVVQVPNPEEKWDRKWYNKNKLLHMYSGADGVKTGYTSAARRTLVASASRDGQQLVTVTLNASDDWNDSMALMDYGFRQYPVRTIVGKGEVIDRRKTKQESEMAIIAQQSFTYPLAEEERSAVEQKIHIPNTLPSDVREGEQIGNLVLLLQGKKLGTVPLVVSRHAEKESSALFMRWIGLISPEWRERK